MADPADERELLSRMEMFSDIHLRARVGIAARALAEEHCFERNVAQVLAVYEQILAQRRPKPTEDQSALPKAPRFPRETVQTG